MICLYLSATIVSSATKLSNPYIAEKLDIDDGNCLQIHMTPYLIKISKIILFFLYKSDLFWNHTW